MPRESRLYPPPPGLINDLLARWPRLNLVERGQEAQRTLNLGFSRRALATALNCSEGVIRRYLKLAALPAPTRAAVAAGASAKQVLQLKRQGPPLPELDPEQQRRIAEDRLIARCLEGARPWLNRYLPWDGYREQFLEEADRRLWRLGHFNCTEQIHPASPRFAIHRYRPRCRQPQYGPDLIEYLLEWFLRWACRVLASASLRQRLLSALAPVILNYF